jgi:membrane protease subunit HflK
VTKRRIYLETLGVVLQGKNKIILDDNGNGQGVVPYLPLNELNKLKVGN